VNSGEATQKKGSMLTLSRGKCTAKMLRPGTKCAGKGNVPEKKLSCTVNLAQLDMFPQTVSKPS